MPQSAQDRAVVVAVRARPVGGGGGQPGFAEAEQADVRVGSENLHAVADVADGGDGLEDVFIGVAIGAGLGDEANADAKSTEFAEDGLEFEIEGLALPFAQREGGAGKGGRAFGPVVVGEAEVLARDADEVLVEASVPVGVTIDHHGVIARGQVRDGRRLCAAGGQRQAQDGIAEIGEGVGGVEEQRDHRLVGGGGGVGDAKNDFARKGGRCGEQTEKGE